jgi:long-chain fatty acid transport protein
MPEGEINWVEDGNSGTTKAKSAVWPLPHAYFTQQINDRLFWGIGAFTRYGLGVTYPDDWPGRFNIYEVALLSASLNPNIALAVTDKLSVATGLEFIYVMLDLRKRGIVHPVLGGEYDAHIKGADGTGVGLALSAHYQFNEHWAAGIIYRSQMKISARGDMRFSNVSMEIPAGVFAAHFPDGRASSSVILPDSIAGGIAWMPREDFSIELSAIWTRWSTYKALNIETPIGPDSNPKNWKDVWRFGAGIEYDVLDWLALRAGFARALSPMTEPYQDYLAPSSSRNTYSLGAGFKQNAWTFDLAYAFIDVKGRSFHDSPPPDGTGTLNSRSRGTGTHVFSLSVGYAF